VVANWEANHSFSNTELVCTWELFIERKVEPS